MMNDELVHAIKAIVLQAVLEQRPFAYAHISNWDPVAHAVRVVVPSIRDELTGEPLMSGWLPLGTQQAGNNVGIQVAPRGGASLQNPTAGEQCLVAINERGTGVASVVSMFFNNKSRAPSPSLTEPHTHAPSPLLAGEMVATSNGITVRWRQNQTFEISAGKVDVTTTGDTDVTTTGDVNVTSQGQVNIASNGNTTVGSVLARTLVVGLTSVDLVSTVVHLGSPAAIQGVARVGDPIIDNHGIIIGTIKSGSTQVFAS